MSKPAKVKLCSAQCVRDGGWHYPDDGGEPFRCPNLTARTSPEAERDAAIEATSAANDGALKAALAIIREAALTNDRFSSNAVRGRMNIAQVPGPTVGAAFRQAAKNGWIRGDGYESSTDIGTHGHPVRIWASLIYRARAAS